MPDGILVPMAMAQFCVLVGLLLCDASLDSGLSVNVGDVGRLKCGLLRFCLVLSGDFESGEINGVGQGSSQTPLNLSMSVVEIQVLEKKEH